MNFDTKYSLHKSLENHLLLNGSFTDEVGIRNGKAAAILFFEALESNKNEMVYPVTISFLEEVLNQIDLKTPITFGDGLVGIGVVIDYLISRNVLSPDAGNLIVDCEYMIADVLSTKKCNYISIDRGLSGYGIYFLSRFNAIDLIDSTQRKRYAFFINNIIDQSADLFKKISQEKLNLTSIWYGLPGVLLFHYNVLLKGLYPPDQLPFLSQVGYTIFDYLVKSPRQWIHLQAWFVLIYCSDEKLNSLSQDAILNGFLNFVEWAIRDQGVIDYYEGPFLALLLSVIDYRFPNFNCIALREKILFSVYKNLSESNVAKQFPYNEFTKSVSVGLFKGICGTTLPLLSIEYSNYSWLSVLCINHDP